MANFQWRSSHAQCPYYLRSNDLSVTCRCDNGDLLRRRFRSKQACSEHYRRRCAMHWTPCPMVSVIDIIGPD